MSHEPMRTLTMIPHLTGSTFRLELFDRSSYRFPTGQEGVGYRLTEVHDDGREEIVFDTEDGDSALFGCAPSDAIDSLDCARGVLTFLTLRPGDTDPEYFDDYTPAQLAFAEAYGEDLSFYALEDDPIPFDGDSFDDD